MTGKSLADAFVSMRADWSTFDSDLQSRPAASGTQAGSSFATGFGKGAKRIAVGIAGLFAGRQILGTVNGLVDRASDLNETVNKSDVIFGKSAAAIARWSRRADTSFGLSQEAALASAASFGDMFSQLGFTEKAAARMSKSTVKVAADLGSFNNLDTADVLNRISASLRGEFDSLQSVIPNINAARVETEALAMTGKTAAKELTAQEKAAATLAIIQKDGARAAGDFAKTQDGLANSNKTVRAQFENLQTKVGKGLLPVYKAVSGLLRTQVMPALLDLADGTLPKVSREAAKITRNTDFVGFFQSISDSVKGADLSSASADISKVGDAVGKVDWAAVRENLGDSLGDSLDVFGVAIGFVADNADKLADYLPELAAAFALYKTAQLAANLAALVSLPVTGLQVAANFALAKSNRSLTAAIAQTTVTENIATASKSKGVVATIASTVASKAAAVASKAWAGAQILLNVAMRANPIGLAVTAIAALAAGMVLAYKKSETFRGIVDGLWNNVLKPLGSFIGKVFVGYLRTLAKMWLTVGEFGIRAFKWLVDAAFKAFDGILKAAEAGLGWIPGLKGKLASARERFDDFRDKVSGTLERVADKANAMGNALDRATKDRTVTVTVITRGDTKYANGGREAPDAAGRVPAPRGRQALGVGPDAGAGWTMSTGPAGRQAPLVNIEQLITMDPDAAARAQFTEARKALALAGADA